MNCEICHNAVPLIGSGDVVCDCGAWYSKDGRLLEKELPEDQIDAYLFETDSE